METSHLLLAHRPHRPLGVIIALSLALAAVLAASVLAVMVLIHRPVLAVPVLVLQPTGILALGYVFWRWRRQHAAVTRDYRSRNEAVHDKIQQYAELQDKYLLEVSRLREQLHPLEKDVAAGSFFWEQGSDDLHWSAGMYQLSGKSLVYLPTVGDVHAHLCDDDGQAFSQACEQAWRGEISQGCEVQYRQDDGNLRIWQIRLHPLKKDPHGPVERLLGTVRDLTAQRELGRALALERLAHVLLLESVSDAVLICDAEARILRLNQAAIELTGWSRKQSQSQPATQLLRLLQPHTRADLHPIADLMQTTQDSIDTLNAILVTRRGQERRVDLHIAQIRNELGQTTGLVCALRDQTARLQIEDQFRRSQKMESIGRLVSGIAHDFNNLLCGMTGYADLLLRKLDKNTPLHAHASAIVDTAARAGDLTHRLLDVSRHRRNDFDIIDIHDLVEQVTGILKHSVGPDINMVTELQASERHVLGDASALQSALLNLAVNARDAMPEGGELRISTENRLLSSEEFPPLKPGSYLALCVSDNGVGMDEALQQRIFDPFFTTKRRGEGTGLGLPSVRGTIIDHHGALDVASSPGQGSQFQILLPIDSEAEPGTTHAERKDETTRLGRGEWVLVADDEEIIRQMATDILKNLGYRVLVAGDGVEAVELFEQNRQSIRLVLLDVAMPKMNGPTARQRIRNLDEQVPIVMCSGCATEGNFASYGDKYPSPFLAKPFTAGALSRIVAEQLTPATD